MVVYCPSEDPGYASVAREVAETRGDRFVEDQAEIDDGRVVVVAAPMELDSNMVLPFQQRLVAAGPKSNGFGIVTGVTPEDALAQYRPSERQRDRHLILIREETGDFFLSDETGEVLLTSDATTDALRDRENTLSSVSMLAHGRPLHLYLSDGYLCGFPESGISDDGHGETPYCVSDRERDCPLEGEILPAETFDVPNVFVDSCTSMLPSNDRSGLPVHLGMQLLKGTDSLIAGYRQMDSTYHLPLLHYCLLRAGYTTAERCYILNKVAHAHDMAAYPYLPFGRPEHSLDTTQPAAYSVTRSGAELKFSGVDTWMIDVHVDGDAVSNERIFLRNLTEKYADAPLYYAAFDEGDAVRLLIYTWGRAQAETLRFELSRDRFGEERVRLCEAAFENFRRVSRLGLLDKKAKGQLRDLKNRVRGLVTDDYRQRFDANRYRKLDERLSRVTDGIDRIQDRLRMKFDDRYASYLSEDYLDDFAKTGARVDGTCPYCDRPLFSKRFTVTVGETARSRGTCPAHGVVYDVPANDEVTAAIPKMGGQFSVKSDESTTFQVRFQNPRSVRMRTVVFPWLGTDNDEYRAKDVFSPAEERTTLAPGERVSVTFEMETTELPPNEYWLSGYVLGNLNVYQGLRSVVVGEKVGHRRSDVVPDPG